MRTSCYSLAVALGALMLLPTAALAQHEVSISADPLPLVEASESAPDRGGDLVILEQHNVDFVDRSMIACATAADPGPQMNTENSWWRLFELPALGLTAPLTINEAHVGFGTVNYFGADVRTASLRFYELAPTDGFFIDNLVLVGEIEFPVEAEYQAVITPFDIPDVVVSQTSNLVVELFVPSCVVESGDGCHIRAGGNQEGQSAPTYLSTITSCANSGIFEPTPQGDLNPAWADLAWVITVFGNVGGVSNEGEAVAHDVVLGLFPNPVVRAATLQLQTVAPEHVIVTVVDMLGRTVSTAHDGPVSGQMDVSLDAAGLSSGTYVVQIQGETFRSTRLFSIAR